MALTTARSAARIRAAVAVLVSASALLSLTACAGETRTGPTLVTTKSSTQLLMNEAVTRVPGYMVSGDKSYEDLSEACDVDDNDDGAIRLWRSSATVNLVDNASVRSDTIIKELVAGFGEQGWVAHPADEGAVELTHGSSTSTLRFAPTPLESGSGGTLRIEARGACVTTDGPDSDEVKTLENRTE
jgi:hypothetical protein